MQKGLTKSTKAPILRWFMLLLVIAVMASLWASLRQPSYQGKTAVFWLEKMESPVDQEAAISAFRGMGKPGVLFLADEIRSKKSASLRWRIADALNRFQGRFARGLADKVLGNHDGDRVGAAFKVIIKLGPHAEPALPALMQRLKSHGFIYQDISSMLPGSREVAALEAMGDKKTNAIPDFIKLLRSNMEDTACAGADLLASIGPKAKPAIPALLEQMCLHGANYSNAVAGALWKIDRQTNFALGVLSHGLRPAPNLHLEYQLRYLRDMGSAAKPAAILILPLLQDSNPIVRVAAADALREMDPLLYAQALDAINARSSTNLQRLIQLLHGTQEDRTAALGSLVVYGSDAKPALPAIIQILQNATVSGSELDVENAASVIAEIGPDACEAVPALRSALARRGWHYGPFVVCRALANIGANASAAAPALDNLARLPVSQSNSRNAPLFQAGAAAALARITPQTETGLGSILMSLTNFSVAGFEEGFPQVSLPAKVALWRLGQEKEAPVHELMLPSDMWQVSVSVELLGDIGPTAIPALFYLKEILMSHYDVRLRRRAALAIRKIDPQEAGRLHLPGILALP
jgi:HEAT repeat protein